MTESSAGWYGFSSGAFQDVQQKTFSRLQEFGEWSHGRYKSIVEERLPIDDPRYDHINKRKSRMDLVRLSAAVCGIEFCYAAETAFVSPTLLKIGIPVRFMTLIWCLSPAIGFFLVPFLGSCSDHCKSWLGRRRPFILLLSIGIVFGLLIVPHGEDIVYFLGDPVPVHANQTLTFINDTLSGLDGAADDDSEIFPDAPVRAFGILLTIIGVMSLDLCADSCQSPARAYLLDVCITEDHGRGLSTFTAMAGLGGGMGYILGAIHWERTAFGAAVGGQEAAVFLLVLIIYIGCLFVTVTSFKEMPLRDIELLRDTRQRGVSRGAIFEPLEEPFGSALVHSYSREPLGITNGGAYENFSDFVPLTDEIIADHPVTLKDYLWSIIFMPASLRVLCLTNLCCWMSLVCYSLYFTDFVGQSVFGGDPMAVGRLGHQSRTAYEEGVRWGCWGMAVYSVGCACYSAIIERLIAKFGAKRVYVGGQLVYTVGMLLMAIFRTKASVIIFSASAGIMYSTLFTMPFFLVAHYHSSGLFQEEQPISARSAQRRNHVRGLGTDVATVSSMVFLAQFILSGLNGSLVHFTGTPTSTVVLSAILSFCGAFAATKVTYLEM